MKKVNWDKFGESLRELSFIPDQYGNDKGCYSTFEVAPLFRVVSKENFDQMGLGITLEQLMKSVVGYYNLVGYWPEDELSDKMDRVLNCLNIYHNEYINVLIAWYWEGDGTLLVGQDGVFAINYDCKKSYGWKELKL